MLAVFDICTTFVILHSGICHFVKVFITLRNPLKSVYICLIELRRRLCLLTRVVLRITKLFG